jgi:cytidylate kinase
MPTNLLQTQVEKLEQAERHWKASHDRRSTKKGLTIAIAREAGSQAQAVAAEVGKRLNWPVYDNLLLEKIANEMGLRTSLLESVDEKQKSWLLEVLEGFASARSVSEMSYVRHLTQTILSLGAHGNCIIVGRGAAHLLPAGTTLRVRLVGLLKDRIQAASGYLHLSNDHAARWVADTDKERKKFVMDFFLKDPTDPTFYDMVLNVSTWPVPACAELILDGMRRLEKLAL